MALFAVLGAMTFGAKLAMSFLANIEPVSLFIMLFAAVFGIKSLYPTFLYVLLEILCYGIGTWNIYYLYAWPLLALAALLLRPVRARLPWAILSGIFGLAFGALCGVTDIFLLGGIAPTVAKWVSGLPFDIVHCIGNFALALLLFAPLRQLLEKLYKRM